MTQKLKVQSIHDGDSYKAIIDDVLTPLRIWGIDTPEIYSPPFVCKSQDGGKEVSDLVRSELKGVEVEIEIIGKDKFGRTLVKVFLNGEDYALSLVKRGWAWVLRESKMTNEYYETLQSAKRLAEIRKDGIWGMKGRKIRPDTFRKRNGCN